MKTASLAILLAAAPVVSASRAQTPEPTPDALVDQAWQLLPPYDGEVPPSLSQAAGARADAAAHLLEAALELDPVHVRALWSLGHGESLRERDRRGRGELAPAQVHAARGEEALGAAIALDDADPWARYSRALARLGRGDAGGALVDLEDAVGLAEARIEAGESQLEWLRFKALGWRAEACLRLGDFERGRAELETYHGEFSTNRWPYLIALADAYLRERDLESARRTYAEITAAFRSDDQAWALLAYVEGLLGDRAGACAHLEAAIERQVRPGMYTRLWLAILSDGEAHRAAVEDLTEFLHDPPPDPTEWDLSIGRYFVGLLEEDAFLQTLQKEIARRREAAEALDSIECEAWFYVGLRREREARASGQSLVPALMAQRRALLDAPVGWKWEWAYARAEFAELAAELDRASATRPHPAEASLSVVERDLRAPRWHRPGAPRATPGLEGSPRPGDLLIGRPTAASISGERCYFVDVAP